jgi:hypothetical protein
MEIKFNPNVIPGAPAVPANNAIGQSGAAAAGQDTASLSTSDALMSSINSISPVRPEKVQAALATLSTTNYPQDAILNAVAGLFEENIR